MALCSVAKVLVPRAGTERDALGGVVPGETRTMNKRGGLKGRTEEAGRQSMSGQISHVTLFFSQTALP